MAYRIHIINGPHEGVSNIPPVDEGDIAAWMRLANPNASCVSGDMIDAIAETKHRGKLIFKREQLEHDVQRVQSTRSHCAYQLMNVSVENESCYYKFFGEVESDWQPQDIPPDDEGFLLNW